MDADNKVWGNTAFADCRGADCKAAVHTVVAAHIAAAGSMAVGSTAWGNSFAAGSMAAGDRVGGSSSAVAYRAADNIVAAACRGSGNKPGFPQQTLRYPTQSSPVLLPTLGGYIFHSSRSSHLPI